MVCYNRLALQESKSGGRCFAFKSQISDLRFEITDERAKERKVRTPKGSEPANGGAPAQIPDSKFQIGKGAWIFPGDDKCNRKQTSQVCFEISD
jgi:hypothetical protein